MDHNLPIRKPNGPSDIADAGFVSGTMGTGSSPRHEFNPDVVVLVVVEALNRSGIRLHVDIEPSPYTARAAAVDLLRALGVRPANAPLGQ